MWVSSQPQSRWAVKWGCVSASVEVGRHIRRYDMMVQVTLTLAKVRPLSGTFVFSSLSASKAGEV